MLGGHNHAPDEKCDIKDNEERKGNSEGYDPGPHISIELVQQLQEGVVDDG